MLYIGRVKTSAICNVGPEFENSIIFTSSCIRNLLRKAYNHLCIFVYGNYTCTYLAELDLIEDVDVDDSIQLLFIHLLL